MILLLTKGVSFPLFSRLKHMIPWRGSPLVLPVRPFGCSSEGLSGFGAGGVSILILVPGMY
jgi:hypothetical protein